MPLLSNYLHLFDSMAAMLWTTAAPFLVIAWFWYGFSLFRESNRAIRRKNAVKRAKLKLHNKELTK